MNKDMAKVYEYCRRKYWGRFDKLVLMTNATLLPTEAEISALKKYGENLQIQISNYGKLSYQFKETSDLYTANGIPFIIKKYHDDDQHFGGWIDNSKLVKSNETADEAHQRTLGCQQVKLKNMHCYRGQLNRCSQSCFMYTLGVVQPNPGDSVDLNDNSISLDEKREIIANFYNYPRASCFYCVWSEMEKNILARFPAAEQL
jgi:small nuclear ribonucleoprotein (snRNP)-like protein